MGVLARRMIRPDPTDEVVGLWDRRVADQAALSGAFDDRLKELSALKAELTPLLDIASTLDEANAIRDQAQQAADDVETVGNLRSDLLDKRESAIASDEANLKARIEAMAAEEAAQAQERAGLEDDKAQQGRILAARAVALDKADGVLDDARVKLAADQAQLKADRAEVNKLLAKLQQPE